MKEREREQRTDLYSLSSLPNFMMCTKTLVTVVLTSNLPSMPIINLQPVKRFCNLLNHHHQQANLKTTSMAFAQSIMIVHTFIQLDAERISFGLINISIKITAKEMDN